MHRCSISPNYNSSCWLKGSEQTPSASISTEQTPSLVPNFHLFIHSFAHKILSTQYVTSVSLGAGETAVNMADGPATIEDHSYCLSVLFTYLPPSSSKLSVLSLSSMACYGSCFSGQPTVLGKAELWCDGDLGSNPSSTQSAGTFDKLLFSSPSLVCLLCRKDTIIPILHGFCKD